jgi:hypothetical protein
VVVAVGITIVQPEDGTLPTSGFIETVRAPLTAQVKVILSPNVIAFLLAEKVFIAGGVLVIAVSVPVVFDVSTVTVTDPVTEP